MRVAKINRKFILCAVLTLAMIGILLVPVATVSAAGPWTITAVPMQGVTISPSGVTSVADGGSQNYTITANSGYTLQAVWAGTGPNVNNGVKNKGAVTSYTFDNVTANMWIGATVSPYALQLVGATTVNLTQSQLEQMATDHPASYTDNTSNVWSGVALWRLVALVDDADNTTFNSAAVNVCTVYEGASDSSVGTGFSGSLVVSSQGSDNSIVIANTENATALAGSSYPLRAVGDPIGGVKGMNTLGGLVKITLANLPVNTVSISPASQLVANGASFTVSLAINTDNEVRGWQANVNFDATRMQCTGVITKGGFLETWASEFGDNMTYPTSPTIDNTNGYVNNISAAILGTANLGGPTGSGTLCTLSFTADPGINNYASIGVSSVVVSDQNGNTCPGVDLIGGQVAIGNVPMPDLVVSALSAAKAGDNTYTITYTITNQGNLGAGACSTSIVIDGGAPITLACPALAASVFDTETTAAQTISGSTDTILVTADSANVVAEGNESNNTRQITYALVGGIGTTYLNGNIAAVLQLVVPAAIDPWNLVVGNTNAVYGTMNIKCNTTWQVQVSDQNSSTNGHMTKWLLSSGYDPSVQLTAPLVVGATAYVNLSGTPQTIVTGNTSGQSGSIGQNTTIGFYQNVLYADPVLGGGYTYHIVVTFTASSTF